MGMTMTQKILARHARVDHLDAGALVEVPVDLSVGNDITAPIAIREFESTGAKSVFNPDRAVVALDHFTPNKDIKSAEQCAQCRAFALRQNLKHFYDVGSVGIEHCLIPEQGLVKPGDAVVGADSHTCTYGALNAFSTGVGSTDLAYALATGRAWFRVPSAVKITLNGKPNRWVGGKDVVLHIIGLIGVDGALYQSMEFAGEGLRYLGMDDRFAIANMAIEAGGKNGIFPCDSQTRAYMAEHAPDQSFMAADADADAVYAAEISVDLAQLEPTVSFPFLPSNTRTPEAFGRIPVDQVVIGSCTNGRISDLRAAASILAGRKGARVHKSTRTIILPGTQAIYLQALREGLIEDFILAGAAVSTPTCGPCLGGHMGVLAKGERCVSTTNRNFVGRMGHPESEVYLSGPAVAAQTALCGYLAAPEV